MRANHVTDGEAGHHARAVEARVTDEKAPFQLEPFRLDRFGADASWEFPSKLPELNAVEGCWGQLQEWFKYRLVPELSTLKDYISRGANMISEPSIWPYLTGKDLT